MDLQKAMKKMEEPMRLEQTMKKIEDKLDAAKEEACSAKERIEMLGAQVRRLRKSKLPQPAVTEPTSQSEPAPTSAPQPAPQSETAPQPAHTLHIPPHLMKHVVVLRMGDELRHLGDRGVLHEARSDTLRVRDAHGDRQEREQEGDGAHDRHLVVATPRPRATQAAEPRGEIFAG